MKFDKEQNKQKTRWKELTDDTNVINKYLQSHIKHHRLEPYTISLIA
jgi:hypothetical protein